MGEAGGAEKACRHIGTKEEFVKVRKKDLERLTTEVMQIRDFLPRILNGEVLESFQKLKIVEKNLERKEQELEQLKMDCEHFKARLETVQADSIRDKKEKLALRQQLSEAKQQLLQQAEYCTEMGAAACTLLWGVSSSEEVVKAILGGDKALKFFSITGQTMESFVKSLDGDIKELDSDENQFVFALAGIVTNVAAIACGREFLVNSSRVLLDTILQLLGDLKPGQCTKLKVLMLMSLYNVSINLKGLKYISESPGFIPLLWWLLSGEKLFQSESQEGLLPLECGPVCPGQIPLSSKHLPFSQFSWKLEFVQARWPLGEARWKSWCEPRSLVSFSQAVASHGHMHILAFSVILPFGGRTQECCGAPWRVGENPGVVRCPTEGGGEPGSAVAPHEGKQGREMSTGEGVLPSPSMGHCACLVRWRNFLGTE
ncbi:heat shock factor 2-binding protein isoform X2 [Macaca nemestrina]|uniref:heat shock factor 2-binding protein isoform X2 n=1 Tax=Macaca nemestrina TaxID=9545 RepID=UPI0039B8ADA7